MPPKRPTSGDENNQNAKRPKSQSSAPDYTKCVGWAKTKGEKCKKPVKTEGEPQPRLCRQHVSDRESNRRLEAATREWEIARNGPQSPEGGSTSPPGTQTGEGGQPPGPQTGDGGQPTESTPATGGENQLSLDHGSEPQTGLPTGLPTGQAPGQVTEPQDDRDACEYFNEELQRLKDQDDVKEWLRASDPDGGSTLQYEQAFFSIQAVAQAIPQDPETSHRFSLMDYGSLVGNNSAIGVDPAFPCVRPNHMLLLPWTNGDHAVLVIYQSQNRRHVPPELQEDLPKDSDGPVIARYVLDSAPWLSKKEDRRRIIQETDNLIGRISWNQQNFPILESALWVESAGQAFGTTGALYTVLNAWSLLLGYEIDRMFWPQASFLEDALELIHLVRGGFSDWRLIRDFLACRKFITNYNPTNLPTFPKTIPQAEQNATLEAIRRTEGAGAEDEFLRNLQQGTSIRSAFPRLPFVQPYQGDFPSDGWMEDDFERRVPYLQKWGLLDPRMALPMLRRLFCDQQADPRTVWSRSLPQMISELRKRETRPANIVSPLEVIQTYTETFHVKTKDQVAAINNAIQEYSDGRLAAYRRLIDLTAAVGSMIPEDGTDDHLDEGSIAALAIASVQDAIMRKQGDDKGLGGFAMYDLSIGLETVQRNGRSLRTIPQVVRPRRVWMIPYRLTGDPKSRRTHIVLLVLQEEKGDDDQPQFNIYVIDPRPTLSKKEDYEQELVRIKDLARVTGWTQHRNNDSHVQFTDFDVKRHRKRVWDFQDGYSGVHAILNAWICSLGLRPDGPVAGKTGIRKRTTPSFYENAWYLIRLAMAGIADWSIITAFLISEELVVERELQSVPRSRRFAHTSPMLRPVFTQRRQLLIRQDDSVRDDSPSDAKNPYDFRNNIGSAGPAKDEGYGYDLEDDDDDDDNDPFKPMTKPSQEQLPDIDVCEFLRTELEKLKARGDVRSWFQECQKAFSGPKRGWARQFAVTSVTAAITGIQPSSGGFSFFGGEDWKTLKERNTPVSVVRFGRPMLIALYREEHHALLIIQLNEGGEPSFSVIDSDVWRDKKDPRESVYSVARDILLHTDWLTTILPDNSNVEDYLPKSLNWLRGVQQQDVGLSSWMPIFHAWAMALGLELAIGPETAPNPKDKDTFRNQASDMVWLACGGLLDWRVIAAFLLCHGFVKHGRVPTSRRFPRTHPVRNNEDIAKHKTSLRNSDDAYRERWHQKRFHGLARLSRTLVPPPGEFVPPPPPVPTPEELLDAFVKDFNVEGSRECSALARDFQKYLDKHFDMASGMADPCKYFTDRFQCLQTLRWNFKRKIYTTGDTWILGGDGFNGRSIPLDQYLNDDMLITALTSVIGGINTEQDPIGGFTFVSPVNVSWALNSSGPITNSPFGVVARPRRCWLLPLVIDGPFLKEFLHYRRTFGGVVEKRKPTSRDRPGGHIILVVVQEEPKAPDNPETEFRIYFLDSAPQFTEKARCFLVEKIKALATQLRWSTPQNDNNTVRFSRYHWDVAVAEQETDWECGLHTILNSWILAMGLSPAIWSADHATIQQELISLIHCAYDGVLDWKTLFSWFVCRKLVNETSFAEVPQSRQFETTLVQTNINKIQDRVEDANVEDAMVESQNFPYFHETNVDFGRKEFDTGKHDCQKWDNWKSSKNYDKYRPGLSRGYEDTDEESFSDMSYFDEDQEVEMIWEDEDSTTDSDDLGFLMDY